MQIKNCIFILLIATLLSSTGLVYCHGALVTHLEFEGNTTDTTGNITYTGTPGAYVAGPAGFGQAMQFQKALANVVYAEGVGTQLSSMTTQSTVSMWAYGSSLLPSASDPTVLFSANDPVNWSRMSYQYPYDSANDYVFMDTWSSTGALDRNYRYAGDTQFYKDGWHHIAFVKNTGLGDTSSVDARMKIYVDGALWHDSTVYGYGAGDGTGDLGGIENIYLGAEKQYWQFWDGIVDDFRIYDEELSQAEIQVLMTPGSDPIYAINPTPQNDAAGVSINTDLSWNPDPAAVSHDVYFGTSFTSVDSAAPGSPEYEGNHTEAVYDPGTLSYNTDYFWRIDENDGSTTYKGTVWSFTTSEVLATNPSPQNDASGVGINTGLSWDPYVAAVSHDVFFGTSFATVDSATPISPEYEGNQTETTYDPGMLSYDTDYFWRIDENDGSITHKGTVWTFKTEASSISKASDPYPKHNATNWYLNSNLRWAPGESAASHDLFISDNYDEVNTATTASSCYVGNLTDHVYQNPGLFKSATTYYWRVDEINGALNAQGDVWSFTTETSLETIDMNSGSNFVEISNSLQKIRFTEEPINRLTSGYFSNAANFSGTATDRLSIDYLPDFNADEFSVEFFAKLSDLGGFQVIISRGPKQAGHWEVYANANGYACYYIKTDSADNIEESTRIIDDNLWHYITLRINKNTSQAVLTVDGTVVIDETFTGTLISTTEPIYIGGLSDEESPNILPIDGAIDETRISNTWRTSIYTPPAPFSPDANTIGLYHFDSIANNEFADSSTSGNPAVISSAGDLYQLTTYVKNYDTWLPLFNAQHPVLEGASFDLRPSSYSIVEDSAERKAVLLSGTHPTEGYNWDVLVEANSGSPLIKFLITCHLTSSLSIASGNQPTAALWLDQPSVDVLIEQGPMSIYNGNNYGLGFPAAYLWDSNKEAVLFFNMTPMTWMSSGNIQRFRDCRIQSTTASNQFGIGLVPFSMSGNTIPSGDMQIEYYLYSAYRDTQPSKLQGLQKMIEASAPVHDSTAWFPTNRQPPYELSWEVFADKAIDQLMIPNVTSYNEVSGWSDDPLNLVPTVDYIYTHSGRPYHTGWDFSTVNNHLSPWILYTRMVDDTAKRDLAMLKKDDLPLFYDPVTKMTRWGTRQPAHIGNVSMSWQSFFYDIETYRSHKVLAPDDFNPAIPGRFLMGTEGLIEYAQNENYVFGQFFDAVNKVAIVQQDLPALGVIREPWQAGSYAMIMISAYDITGEDQYLQEAKTSIDTLLTTMSFNVTNDYYNITYDDPVDFPITELFGNAYGAVASYRVYQQTSESKYLQYSRDFLHTLLRLTFWYEDETNIYSQDLGNLGLFTPHGGAGNTTPWETTDAYIAITWLLKHYEDLPEKELLLKLANLYRINSFHYYPVTYTDTVRALGIDDSVNPYHPVEPFYSMEYGGHSGVPACYMSNTGMWNFWMYEALAEADDQEIMTLNLDTLEDFEYAISSVNRNLIVFNPTNQTRTFSLSYKQLANGDYNTTIDYSTPHFYDFSANGKVDIEDLEIMAAQWVQVPSDPSADIGPESSPDNFVNFLDFAVLAANWGEIDNIDQQTYTKSQLESGISITLEPMEHAVIATELTTGAALKAEIDNAINAQNDIAYAYKLMQVRQRDYSDVSQALIDEWNASMTDYENEDYTAASLKARNIINTL